MKVSHHDSPLQAGNLLAFPWIGPDAIAPGQVFVINPAMVTNEDLIKTEVTFDATVEVAQPEPRIVGFDQIIDNPLDSATWKRIVGTLPHGEGFFKDLDMPVEISARDDASDAFAEVGEILQRFVQAADSATSEAEDNDIAESMGYRLDGPQGLIVDDLKSFAFAKAAALRWSRQIDEPVTVQSLIEQGAIDDAMYQIFKTVEVVDTTAMDDETFERDLLSAELGRVEDAEERLKAIADEVNKALNDARRVKRAIRSLSGIDGMDLDGLADLTRQMADDFQTRAWFVLIEEADESMLGELRAFS